MKHNVFDPDGRLIAPDYIDVSQYWGNSGGKEVHRLEIEIEIDGDVTVSRLTGLTACAELIREDLGDRLIGMDITDYPLCIEFVYKPTPEEMKIRLEKIAVRELAGLKHNLQVAENRVTTCKEKLAQCLVTMVN